LLTALQRTRPATTRDLFVPSPGDKPGTPIYLPGGGRPGAERPVLGDPKKEMPADKEGSTVPSSADKPGVARPGGAPDKGGGPDKKFTRPAPEDPKKVLPTVPAKLRTVPALQPLDKAHALPLADHSDNSNTQFAVLALWAAGRHDLPLERSLALIVQRFRTSQKDDGAWNYNYRKGGGAGGWGTPAMTGAGLLGLAVGHGLTADPRSARKASVKDEAAERGLKALGEHLGKELTDKGVKPAKGAKGRKVPPGRARWTNRDINLYFLWSVERVGVLYNLREIDGKDWYAWGADLLVEAQGADGSWNAGGYPGATRMVDTCLALLFLKRANLAADLTERLEFVIETRPGGSGR